MSGDHKSQYNSVNLYNTSVTRLPQYSLKCLIVICVFQPLLLGKVDLKNVIIYRNLLIKSLVANNYCLRIYLKQQRNGNLKKKTLDSDKRFKNIIFPTLLKKLKQ